VREYSIPVVYSTEVPSDVALLPLADAELAKGSVDELAPLRDFRGRILPVFGPLPGLFELHIASYMVYEIAGRLLERPLPVRRRKRLYERMWKDLLHRELRANKSSPSPCLYFPRPKLMIILCVYMCGIISTLPLTTTDIALLYDDFALGRSIVPPHAACVRPDSSARTMGPACTNQPRELRRGRDERGGAYGAGVLCEVVPPQDVDDYVDALGDPIYRDTFAPKDSLEALKRCGVSRLLGSRNPGSHSDAIPRVGIELK
jgi:hypothetical protein